MRVGVFDMEQPSGIACVVGTCHSVGHDFAESHDEADRCQGIGEAGAGQRGHPVGGGLGFDDAAQRLGPHRQLPRVGHQVDERTLLPWQRLLVDEESGGLGCGGHRRHIALPSDTDAIWGAAVDLVREGVPRGTAHRSTRSSAH